MNLQPTENTINASNDHYQFVANETLNATVIRFQILAGSKIVASHYNQVVFSESSFFACEFQGVTFSNCIFENATFEFSHFRNCHFVNCSFVNCKWIASNAINSIYENCELDDSMKEVAPIQSKTDHTTDIYIEFLAAA